MSASKNLIMGFCAALPFQRLAPFIQSLRTIAFAGDVCILVQDVSSDTIRQLRAHGIIVERIGPSAQPHMAAMASRYFSFQDFLLRHGDRYANVLLTDPATTVFAADPFATPLLADIVYSAESTRIGDTPTVHEAVVQAYGEAVAHNIRDCLVSNADSTMATRAGMLRYLGAMTHQLAGRTVRITGTMDRGVHNYVVHMRPLRGAWLAAGPEAVAEPAPAATDAVVAFYLRERDTAWLGLFLGSLRCVSDSVAVHCVGDFTQDDLAILARYNCTGYVVPAVELVMAENAAHFYLTQVIDRLSSAATAPDQVFIIDTMRAAFPRDPFLNKTVGLSVFSEGPTRIGDSGYNRARVELFGSSDETLLHNPVVSSMALRGRLPIVREFYRRMFTELTGRADLLKIHKAVQGVVNTLCHGRTLGFPVIVHPNGAEVFFDFLTSDLAVDARYGIRIGGAVPGVVLAGHPESPLMLKLRVDLNLPDT